MRITTLAKKYSFFCVLLLTLLGQNSLVYSQCPTISNTNQSFCDTQSPTIASLQVVDNGGGVRWYATATSTTALSSSAVLVNGEDYFADDNTGSCGVRQSVTVTIYSAPTGANFQGVCVTNLNQATPSNPQFFIVGNNLQWYTVPVGGTAITPSTILNDNTIYYISQVNPDTGCQTSRLSVFVNVGLVPPPTGSAVQEFCNIPGSPPTVADLVASGNNNWYLTPAFGVPLDPATPLVNGQFYYATTIDPPCESSDRLEVLVNIYDLNDAGNDGNRSICVDQVSTTPPFDLFGLLGGTPDNTGTWSGPIATTNGSQGTLNVSAMTLAGSPYTFTYTVSSALCAPDTSTVTITILPLPTASVSVSPTTICANSSATFTFTGTPNATVTYNINGGANQTVTLNASGTATISGTYTTNTTINIVSVASAGAPSCINPQTSSTTLTVLPLPTASVSVSPTTICANSSATFTFTGTPNATVTYNINGGANQTVTLNASGTATISGTYITNTTINIVNVASAGTPSCINPQTSSTVLTVLPLPTASVSVSPTNICANSSATFTFTGTPNATVTYNINGGANQTVTLNASGTATISGTYTTNTTINIVSVTSAGTPSCINPQTSSTTLTILPLPTASVSVSPTTICANSSATFTFTGTPNATVTYNINGGANQTVTLNASGTATISGTYTTNTTINIVSVASAGTPSCINPQTSSTTLTILPLPTASVSVSPTNICANSSATFTFTGTPNATVTYNINGGANQTVTLNASGTATISGTYTTNTTINIVSVASAGTPSCINPQTSSTTLTVLPLPTASLSVSPTTICANSSATFTFTGTPNATVTYNINGGANQTVTLNASGTATISGTYTTNTTINIVSVASAGTPSCINPQTSSTVLTVLPLPTASVSVSPTTICANSSATFTFTGTPNATVTYNINGGANQTVTLNASGTATISGTYTTNTTINIVSVASAGTPSCINPQTSSTTLTVLPLPTASVSVSPTNICANSSATFTFTGTPNATVTYNINGGANQTVTLNTSGTATISGTYTTNTTINIVSVTSAGTPSCINPQTSSTTLTVLPLPTASVSVSPTTICANSSATFTFTGTPNATVTYNINGGANQTVTLNASGTATISGTYTTNTTINIVSVASAGTPSCINPQTSSTTLTVLPLPTASVSVSPTNICANSSATFTFTGTPNATVTYNINGGANQTVTLNASGTATISGTYTTNTTINIVSVASAGAPSCINPQTSSTTLTILPLPTASVSVSPTNICANSSTTFTFTGTPNATVTYNINGGANQTVTLNASGTATISGTYTTNTTINIVSVTSAGTPSCINPQTSSTTLTILPLPTASVSVSPTTICANSSATFTFTGTPNATVTYNINGGANQTVTLNASGTATISGTYTTNTTINIVSVASAGTPSCINPQTSSTTLTIVQPPIPGNDGSVTLCVLSPSVDLFTLLGSTAQTGGVWSPALTSGTGVFNPAVDPAGTYTYTLNGTAPCTNVSASVQVIVNPVPDAGNNGILAICSNQNSVDLFASLTGSPQTGGTWSPPLASGTGIFNPAVDLSGVYTYTVTGVSPCVDDTATVTVTVTQGPEAGTDNTITLCVNSVPQDLTLLLGPNSQPGGIWSPTLASGTGVFNPAVDVAGSYTYTLSGTQPCDNDSAVITVTVNPIPNAGDNASVTFCENNPSQDLFALLGTNAQLGGTWSPALASGTGVLNPAVDSAGTYTYTVGGGLCSSDSATVLVTIAQEPNSGGVGQVLNVCVSTTAIDLTTGLDGTQQAGTWSDDDATGALSGSIFNSSTVGVGTYHFTYTVIGDSPCTNASSTVTVIVHPSPVAGIDSSLTVCSTDGTQDLFTLLGSTAETGGTWSPALTSGTGVFNSAIDSQGVYIYTVSSAFCASVSASITVTVNPVANSGGVGQTLTTCTNVTSLDITTGLDGTQGTGTWNDNNNTGALSGNIFNPAAVGVGTYTFTYTVSGTAPCPNATSTVTVVVNSAPNAGVFTGAVTLCSSVGVLDLASLLNGEDTGGVWTDTASQTVISPLAIVSFAAGTYAYTYIVTNTCATDTETVQFTILPNPQMASFNISTSPACLGSDVVVNLNGMVDGTYTLTYDLIGANTAAGQTATVTITGGVGSFTIPASLLPNIGTTVANFATILNTVTNCSITLIGVATQILVRPLADIDTTNLSSTAVCYGADVVVTISGATNLPDGVYQFNYSIPGTNPTTNNSGNVTITGGAGQFTVPATVFGSTGNYTMTIFGIIANTGCTNTTESASVSLVINALPSLQNATVTVQDTCANFASLVTISGANNLADGDYTLTYQLSGANTATTTLTITITGGNGTFSIPASELANNGATTLTINQLDSVTTTCGVTGAIIAPIDFNVTQLGTPQIIQDGNLFCEDDNPTIANLSGNLVGFPTVIWYNAATGGTAYNATDLLVHGTTYYAALTTASGCEGAVRLEVTVDLTVCDDILIPDGYSPNNDGINDTFEIENLAVVYPNFKLEVYNRYGNLIYTGNRNTPNWDGTTTVSGLNLGNNILPNGVYFYILYFNDGVRKPVQGRVYLNR